MNEMQAWIHFLVQLFLKNCVVLQVHRSSDSCPNSVVKMVNIKSWFVKLMVSLNQLFPGASMAPRYAHSHSHSIVGLDYNTITHLSHLHKIQSDFYHSPINTANWINCAPVLNAKLQNTCSCSHWVYLWCPCKGCHNIQIFTPLKYLYNYIEPKSQRRTIVGNSPYPFKMYL